MSSTVQNFTDDSKKVLNFDGLGNDPDQWLKFINDYMKHHCSSKANKMLKQMFFCARECIDMKANTGNESLAKIFVLEATLIGKSNVEDARDAFRNAVVIFKKVPFIHIAFAQFELDQGRRSKAQKVLEFCKMVIPSDKTIDSAILKLNNGSTDLGVRERFSFLSPPLSNMTNVPVQHQVPKSDTGYNTSDTLQSKLKRSHSDVCVNTPPPPIRNSRSHTMAHACDIPASPCSPVCPQSWLTTPQSSQKRKQHAVFDLKTPSPPKLNFSTTKSLNFNVKRESFMPSSTNKTSDHSTTKSSHFSGRPIRIPLQQQIKDVEVEMEGVQPMKDSPASKQRNPQSNVSFFPKKDNLKSAKMPPPTNLPLRVSSQHNIEHEIQDFIKESKVMKVHHQAYLAVKVLGEGGSSKVYEAIDLSNKSIKAIKQVFLKDCDETVKEGFLNEIKFLEKLKQSPNIVHLYDYELTRDHLYLVMECGSTDLAKLLQRQKSQRIKLEPYEIIYFWKKMLAAVKTIHDNGVIHLDLKPANFVLVKGNLKLIDFGIANSIQSDATSIIKDTQFGTVNYMAPEAIMDMSGGSHPDAPKFKISPRADVWSLGCILYSMMFGKTPFQHITHQLMKLNAITNPAYRIEFGDHSHKILLQIVQSCLLRDPKRRPTVEQLLSDL